MKRILAFQHEEVVDHASIAHKRLGTHAALAGNQIVCLYLGHQALQAFRKGGFAEGMVDLLGAFAKIFGRKLPEAGVSKTSERSRQLKSRFVVAFAFMLRTALGRRGMLPSIMRVKCTPRKGKAGLGTG